MRNRAIVFVVMFIGLVTLVVAYGLYRNSQIHSRFNYVQVGGSQADVVRILGSPSWIEPCGKSFGAPKPRCTEYIYRNSFAPIIPEYHSVSFDDTGRVVDTYVYSSP
jgi:hypothetical protein